MSGRLHCTEVPIGNGKCIGNLYLSIKSHAQMIVDWNESEDSRRETNIANIKCFPS